MTGNDDLGDRMKGYENVTRHYLPRRTYTIIRVDGRAFHTLTRNLERPYDEYFMNYMDETAIAMVKDMAGAAFAFVQSDEISILLSDFASIHTEPWFGGNLQKMASIAAATATAHFNSLFYFHPLAEAHGPSKATFDARVFIIPDPVEVYNYFVWRQKDATRNSISAAAQYLFSHQELQKLNVKELQEKMWQERKVNWNDYPAGFKRGRLIKKLPVTKETPVGMVESWQWTAVDPDIFTASEQITDLMPHKSFDPVS